MCDNSIEWCKSLKMHFKWVTNMLYGVECFKMWFGREAEALNMLKQFKMIFKLGTNVLNGLKISKYV